ncbi:MAG TPA: hypothetical protein DDZ80_21085 [Cyanobacteria bacterium UBA8803]|nr:hypothetical protein [Cyanobacteria bacterium UBA9273]HBL60837.1 hypothetical protein [Cyanobacteria bacterium UBA8803]
MARAALVLDWFALLPKLVAFASGVDFKSRKGQLKLVKIIYTIEYYLKNCLNAHIGLGMRE